MSDYESGAGAANDFGLRQVHLAITQRFHPRPVARTGHTPFSIRAPSGPPLPVFGVPVRCHPLLRSRLHRPPMGRRRDSSTRTEVLEGRNVAVEEREAAWQRGAEGRRAGAPAAVHRRLCDLHSRTPPPSQEPLRATHGVVAEHEGSICFWTGIWQTRSTYANAAPPVDLSLSVLFPYDLWNGRIDTFGHLIEDSGHRGEFFLF